MDRYTALADDLTQTQRAHREEIQRLAGLKLCKVCVRAGRVGAGGATPGYEKAAAGITVDKEKGTESMDV